VMVEILWMIMHCHNNDDYNEEVKWDVNGRAFIWGRGNFSLVDLDWRVCGG
jgi:hypothetical protein